MKIHLGIQVATAALQQLGGVGHFVEKEMCHGREFFARSVYLVSVPRRPRESTAGRLRSRAFGELQTTGKEYEEVGDVAGMWHDRVRDRLW